MKHRYAITTGLVLLVLSLGGPTKCEFGQSDDGSHGPNSSSSTPTQLEVTFQPPATLDAVPCHTGELSIQVYDQDHNLMDLGSPVDFNYDLSTDGMYFVGTSIPNFIYTNSTCSTRLNQISIQQGDRTFGFYYRAPEAGILSAPLLMTATIDGLTVNFQQTNVDFNFQVQTMRLSLVTPSSPHVGICYAASIISEISDGAGGYRPFGIPVNQSIPIPANPFIGFYSNSICTQGITTVNLVEGDTSYSFYFKANVAASYPLPVQATVTFVGGNYTFNYTNAILTILP